MTDTHVLVVDDSRLTRALITQVLHQRGIFRISYAADGREALEALDGVHLVVTDWMMPAMDGLELTRRIRSDERHYRLPVLLVTSNFDEADLAEARSAGVDMFIEKTFAPEELNRALDRLLPGGGGAPACGG